MTNDPQFSHVGIARRLGVDENNSSGTSDTRFSLGGVAAGVRSCPACLHPACVLREDEVERGVSGFVVGCEIAGSEAGVDLVTAEAHIEGGDHVAGLADCRNRVPENAVVLLFYFNAPAMPTFAVQVMMILQILETAGISVLAYVTWQ